MSTSISPVSPVQAAGAAANAVTLRPGAVIDATVLQLLENNLVRLAIAGLTLDVASEVSLQAGQTLRFAVTGDAAQLRLVVLPQADATQGVAGIVPASATKPVATSALTAAEAQAVAAATSQAATRQAGLAPLFANLLAASPMAALAPAVRNAMAQVLSARLAGDGMVSGETVRTAVANSGLFLEQRLAGEGAPASGGGPDLKAALLVLRHALGLAREPAAGAPGAAGAAAGAMQQSGRLPAAPSLAPDLPDIALPSTERAGAVRGVEYLAPQTILSAGRRAAATSVMLGLLQDALLAAPTTMVQAAARAGGTEPFARTDLPPPPFRGATPSAQPVAQAAVTPDMPAAAVTHRLLADTDAALARQTLMQIASLPGAPDAQGARLDQAAARWLFELPIALPQGTAVAQFEIARDDARQDETTGEASRRIWRARFSLDIEPAGPIHALVSFSGGTTAVRMWAERPLTAARLRADTPALSQALREAALEPGDIVVGDGAPPSPAPRAGHFWDRAL